MSTCRVCKKPTFIPVADFHIIVCLIKDKYSVNWMIQMPRGVPKYHNELWSFKVVHKNDSSLYFDVVKTEKSYYVEWYDMNRKRHSLSLDFRAVVKETRLILGELHAMA